ncbi:hypothetical protein C8R46DRAFT_419805, partial [Mycena filopes]
QNGDFHLDHHHHHHHRRCRTHTEEPPSDVNLLKKIGRKALVDALNSVNGAKTLVLDTSLAGPLGLVIEVSLLIPTRQQLDRMLSSDF